MIDQQDFIFKTILMIGIYVFSIAFNFYEFLQVLKGGLMCFLTHTVNDANSFLKESYLFKRCYLS